MAPILSSAGAVANAALAFNSANDAPTFEVMPYSVSVIRQFVADVKIELNGASSPTSLLQKHRIGRLANELPVQRGDDRFVAAARGLKGAKVMGMGVSTLRKMAKFASRFTPDEAAALDSRDVSWRDADRLRSRHIQSKIGIALTKQALRSFVRKPRNLGRLITDVSEPQARETARSINTAVARAGAALELLADIAKRAGADAEVREAAYGRLRWLKMKAEILDRKISRSPNAPRPTIRRK